MRRFMNLMAGMAVLALVLAVGATSALAGSKEKGEDPRFECMTSLEASDKGKDTYEEYRHCIASPRHFPSYKGWYANVDHHCDFAPFNADMACTEVYMMHDAYRWSSGAWEVVQIGEGTQVYIHPFGASTEWRWIYTADTGWLAMHVDQLVIRWSAPTGNIAMH